MYPIILYGFLSHDIPNVMNTVFKLCLQGEKYKQAYDNKTFLSFDLFWSLEVVEDIPSPQGGCYHL
jgi:hypothetical protein